MVVGIETRKGVHSWALFTSFRNEQTGDQGANDFVNRLLEGASFPRISSDLQLMLIGHFGLLQAPSNGFRGHG